MPLVGDGDVNQSHQQQSQIRFQSFALRDPSHPSAEFHFKTRTVREAGLLAVLPHFFDVVIAAVSWWQFASEHARTNKFVAE